MAIPEWYNEHMDTEDVREQHEKELASLPKSSLTLHYHGEIVRRLFMAGGAALLILTPIVRDVLPLRASILLLLTFLLAILAGITNPKHVWIMFSDIVVASVALFIFQYAAISGITGGDPTHAILIRQAFAINFFFALYFAAKSLRGALMR